MAEIGEGVEACRLKQVLPRLEEDRPVDPTFAFSILRVFVLPAAVAGARWALFAWLYAAYSNPQLFPVYIPARS